MELPQEFQNLFLVWTEQLIRCRQTSNPFPARQHKIINRKILKHFPVFHWHEKREKCDKLECVEINFDVFEKLTEIINFHFEFNFRVRRYSLENAHSTEWHEFFEFIDDIIGDVEASAHSLTSCIHVLAVIQNAQPTNYRSSFNFGFFNRWKLNKSIDTTTNMLSVCMLFQSSKTHRQPQLHREYVWHATENIKTTDFHLLLCLFLLDSHFDDEKILNWFLVRVADRSLTMKTNEQTIDSFSIHNSFFSISFVWMRFCRVHIFLLIGASEEKNRKFQTRKLLVMLCDFVDTRIT